MQVKCYNCGCIEDFEQNVPIHSECRKCKNDIHCCRNCMFYDESCYNECKETNADRILDKQKSNYCDYFKANPNTLTNSKSQNKEDVYKKLTELFK